MNRAAIGLVAAADQRTYYAWMRFQTMDQWWHWMLLLLVCAAIVAFVVGAYRRDGEELPSAVRVLLTALRLLAFVGLLVFFFQLEKRTEKKLVKNSRVAVLVDTSQSMGLRDTSSTPGPSSPRRLDVVVDEFQAGSMLDDLREKHDVSVYRFDQEERPTELASFGKVVAEAKPGELDPRTPLRWLRESRWLIGIAGGFLVVAALAFGVHLILSRRPLQREGGSWALLVSVLALIVACVTAAVANLRNPQIGIAELLGRQSPSLSTAAEDTAAGDSSDEQPIKVDWETQLQPSGIKTRLGDAIRYVVEKERGGTFGGLIAMTDGNNNAGRDLSDGRQTASNAGIPIFPVGIGSERQPTNVRVVEVESPPRVYPGDAFTLTAFIQAHGMTGRGITVELFRRVAATNADTPATEEFVEERRLPLASDGEAMPVEFELTPDEVGRRVYVARVTPPPKDLDPTDNQRSVSVQIVDRKNRVLLLAGGPTREYRFVRNQFFRDEEMTVDVLLQSSPGDAAQEADEVLDTFPDTADRLFEYDAIVAFDPDWEQLTANQSELLDRWVAEKAGGLVVIAGPVNTPEWSSRRRGSAVLDTVRALYPVAFYGRSGVRLGRGAFEARDPWPVSLTDSGTRARFLWLGDSAIDNETAWSTFAGVYGYQPVRAAKPGATVYARFSNPDAEIDGELPVYMAGQFYGAGRVFYLGSGEMWRLRAVDVTHFEQFYTKLVRYVSEGRLLRDSSRGVLLVDRDRCTLGETIAVRAALTDAQYRPLTMDEVEATVTLPDDTRSVVKLRKVRDTERDGTFAGQFTATVEGDYRIELVIPDSEQYEVLSREVRARVPDVEVENPQLNNASLKELALATGGQYYASFSAALGQEGIPGLAAKIVPQDQETYLPSTPDRDFDRRLMAWLLGLICGVLCLEWLLRRLYKLA